METEKLVKGDIVKNRFAGDKNPRRLMVYLGKSTIRQGRYSHKGYTCLDYDGQITQLFRDNDPLIEVGHMDEYDSFIKALRRLKDGY